MQFTMLSTYLHFADSQSQAQSNTEKMQSNKNITQLTMAFGIRMEKS